MWKGEGGRVKRSIRKKGNSKGNKRGGNIMFWNIADINNKDKENFWNCIDKFDFVSLCKT